MVRVKCFRCGVSAIDDTFEQASKKLNHAVGLSRGIKCGDNYGRVLEIKPKGTVQTKEPIDTVQIEEPKIESSFESETVQEKPKKEKKSKKFKIRK